MKQNTKIRNSFKRIFAVSLAVVTMLTSALPIYAQTIDDNSSKEVVTTQNENNMNIVAEEQKTADETPQLDVQPQPIEQKNKFESITEKSEVEQEKPKQQLTPFLPSEKGKEFYAITDDGVVINYSGSMYTTFAANPVTDDIIYWRKDPGLGYGSGIITATYQGSKQYLYCMNAYEPWPQGQTYTTNPLNNSHIRAILIHGFPANESGLQQKYGVSNQDAYVCTFVALNAYLGVYNRATVEAQGDPYVNALLDWADRGTEKNNLAINRTSVKSVYNSSKNRLESKDTLKVTMNNSTVAQFTLKNLPSGVYAIDTSGNKITTISFGQEFKLATDNLAFSGNFTIDINHNIVNTALTELTCHGYQSLVGWWGSDPAQKLNFDQEFEPALGHVEIGKKDNKGNFIPNTTFKISYNSNMSSPVATVTTGASGKVTKKDVVAGTVYVQETSVPNYLVRDDTIHKVTIVPAQTASFTKTNIRRLGKVILNKEDAETGKTPQGDAVLVGAEYTLYADEDIKDPVTGVLIHAKDKAIAKRVVGDSLQVTWENLDLGKYYIKETKAPIGYLLDKTKHLVDLSPNNANTPIIEKTITSKEQVMKQKFRIMKISSDGSNAEAITLKDVEFTVKLESLVQEQGWESTPNADLVVTNNEGEGISIELPYGVYRVRETHIPPAYDVIPLHEDFFVTVDKDSRDPQAWRIFNNAPFEAYLRLVKKDLDTGETVVLNSATFQLRDMFGAVVRQRVGDKWVDTFTTDEKGKVTTPLMVKSGVYFVHEIETPQGFLELDQPIRVEVTGKRAYEVDEAGNPVIEVEVHNSTPKVTLQLTKRFEMPEFDNPVMKMAGFRLSICTDLVNPIDGTLIYKAGDVIPNPNTNNGLYYVQNGETLEIKNLPMGLESVTYSLTEVETEFNYKPLEEPVYYEFTIEDQVKKEYIGEQEVENKLYKPELKTKATGLNGEKVFDRTVDNKVIDTVKYKDVDPLKTYTKYVVAFDKTHNKIVATQFEKDVRFETSDGEYVIELLIKANTLKEDSDIVFFEYLFEQGKDDPEIDEPVVKHEDPEDEDQTIRFTVFESTIKGRKVTDYPEGLLNQGVENKPMEGVEFELRMETENGKVYDKVKTGKNGSFEFKVPLGVYYLVETKTHEGFQLLTTPIRIEVTEGGKVIDLGDIKNSPIIGDVVGNHGNGGYTDNLAVNTGDTSLFILFAIIAIFAAGTVICTVIYKRKQRTVEEVE